MLFVLRFSRPPWREKHVTNPRRSLDAFGSVPLQKFQQLFLPRLSEREAIECKRLLEVVDARSLESGSIVNRHSIFDGPTKIQKGIISF
jgi:hypothetical protein